MNIGLKFFYILFVIICMVGCYGRMPSSDVENAKIYGTYNVQRTPGDEINREGTVIFVRPKNSHRLFGTESLRDYIEIVYENAFRNKAGLYEVKLGIRNIGGLHYYDKNSENFPLSIKTVFYDNPVNINGVRSVPIYKTNWQTIKMIRGTVTDYTAICPIQSASYYQIVISEILKK